MAANKHPKQLGFTIVELLVAISIGAIASVLIMTAFVYTYGSVVVEETRAAMTRESQVFLRRMVEDIRVGNQIRTNNLIPDPCGAGDSWTTSDPANILIATSPATDVANDFIYNDATSFPYQHEVIYFSRNSSMFRRFIRNDGATASIQQSTCSAGTVGFLNDIELVSNVENMLFEFYDSNNIVTAVPEDARSVQITINLRKKVYGKDIKTTNTTRITLRNEN